MNTDDKKLPLEKTHPIPISNPVLSKFDVKETPENQCTGLATSQSSWRKKLIKTLGKQLQLFEIKSVVDSFVGKLQEEKESFPDLPSVRDEIAKYLVENQYDRHLLITSFFVSLVENNINQSSREPLDKLFAYLLHTLIVKCYDDNDKGASQISVSKIPTVGLIGSGKNNNPHIPDYGEPKEHKNSMKNPHAMDVGTYIPITGIWDVDKTCEAIALNILPKFGETDKNGENPIDQLASKLKTFRSDIHNAPIQTLYVDQALHTSPLRVTEVAEKFYSVLGNLLWIYIYGVQSSKKGKDWLHCSELEIKDLIERYEKIMEQKFQSTQSEPNEASKPMNNGFTISNISNATVIVNSSNNNVQINETVKAELLTLLEQLKTSSNNTELSETSQKIENELQKPDGADKSVLARLSKLLSGVSTAKNIAENINKISQLLLPLIS